MTREEKLIHLNAITNNLSAILSQVEPLTLDDFQREEQVKEVVFTRLQESGQAAHHLEAYIQNQESREDLKVLANFRNARYNLEAEIDTQPVWNLIQNDLEPIRRSIHAESLEQ